MEDDLERQRRQDDKDFNAELAGLETGRLKRFFPNSAADRAETTRQREERQFQSALQQMLMDREYARLYADAQSALDSAQRALEQAILENTQAVERLERLIEEFNANAAELENGEKVFRSEDGHLYTASGRRLSSGEASTVEIPPNAPSYEQYTQANDALNGVRERGRELTGERTDELARERERMRDNDNPMSKDELQDSARRMERFERDLEVSGVSDFRVASSPQQVEAEAQANLTADLGDIPSL